MNSPLENTEGAIKNGQSRETGTMYTACTQNTRRRQKQQKKPKTQYLLDTTMRKQIQII